MEIIEVGPDHYAQQFPQPHHIFNAAAFNALNAHKCEKVYYLLFKDSKIRLGIIFGVRNNILTAPFSAPFGSFENATDDIRLQQIDAALEALEKWAVSKNFEGVRIVPAPLFYNPNFGSKLKNCLFRAGYDKRNIELNFQFPTSKAEESYESNIWYNARKNLIRANASGLVFKKIPIAEGRKAHEIIAQNRMQRGFPLRMTWEQVAETMDVVTVDFFIVEKDSVGIAAAVVFHVSPNVVQIIYWGDLPSFAEYKTMNFLSYNIFKHYKDQGIGVVDVGPSTENSVPNYGLCEFKESIGCDMSTKTEFFKKLMMFLVHSNIIYQNIEGVLQL